MKKFMLVLMLVVGLVSCGGAGEEGTATVLPATVTAPVVVATDMPATVAVPPTETNIPPTATTQMLDRNDLAMFVDALEGGIQGQDFEQLTTMMSDPMAVGAWRSEWRMYTPSEMVGWFGQSLPAPTNVEFTGLSEDEIGRLIGQPPATILPPTIQVAAVLHSKGWGEAGRDEAILFVVEEAGQYRWSAFLYTNGGFMDEVEAVPTEDMPAPEVVYPDPSTLAIYETRVASPDGRWEAITAYTEPVMVGDRQEFYASLLVTDGERSWTPFYGWQGYGLGYTVPAVYRWSEDGRYLYYTNSGAGDGCFTYSSGTDLYRLDVRDGSELVILPQNVTFNFALSPDESEVAYVERYEFVVQEIAGSGMRRVSFADEGEIVQTDKIFWSADGKMVFFTVVYEPCGLNETHRIVRVDVDTMAVLHLVEKDSRLFSIDDWANEEQTALRLRDKDGQFWRLDVMSGDLVQE